MKPNGTKEKFRKAFDEIDDLCKDGVVYLAAKQSYISSGHMVLFLKGGVEELIAKEVANEIGIKFSQGDPFISYRGGFLNNDKMLSPHFFIGVQDEDDPKKALKKLKEARELLELSSNIIIDGVRTLASSIIRKGNEDQFELPKVSGTYEGSTDNLERRVLLALGREENEIRPDEATRDTLADVARFIRQYKLETAPPHRKASEKDLERAFGIKPGELDEVSPKE